MELKLFRCTRCGGELQGQNGVFKCLACDATFVRNYVEDNDNIVSKYISESKKDAIANLRKQLWEEVNKQYMSSYAINQLAGEIKTYLPDDFFANFFMAAVSKNRHDLVNFIQNKIDCNKEQDNIDFLIDFIIKNALNYDNLLSVNNLIEQAYQNTNFEKYKHWSSILAKKAESIKNGLYETTIPRDIFVAYSSKDFNIVESIVEKLEAKGLTCFVALRNLRHGIDATENYNRRIREAIDHCKIFLFISSKNSRDFNCDAYKLELQYVWQKDVENAPSKYKNSYNNIPNKKPRILYVLDTDNSGAYIAIKEFFEGLEWCGNINELELRVSQLLRDITSPIVNNMQKNIFSP